MARLHGRAGRLTAQNGGLGCGQFRGRGGLRTVLLVSHGGLLTEAFGRRGLDEGLLLFMPPPHSRLY